MDLAVGGSERRNFFDLLDAAMNNKTIVITSDEKVVEEATAEAREKIEQLRDEFEKWIWSDAARKKALLEKYNREFTGNVLREYDGSHLTCCRARTR